MKFDGFDALRSIYACASSRDGNPLVSSVPILVSRRLVERTNIPHGFSSVAVVLLGSSCGLCDLNVAGSSSGAALVPGNGAGLTAPPRSRLTTSVYFGSSDLMTSLCATARPTLVLEFGV